jgi:internalin A
MKELRGKFPQIVGLYKIDSEDGKGIPALEDIISETSWHLPHMRTPWIKSWYNVRERLEQDGRNWIGYEEFKQICKSEGLNKKQTEILDEYLHDLGAIIHFRDRLELRNMVILKPEWATKAVYKILDTQSILDRGGILLHSELDQIWDLDIYPQDIFSKLLGLMNKFELAYELPDKNSHLVAELLPKTEPEFGWDETNNLRFYYHYDFMPAGVITRFIVLMHEDLEDKQDGTYLCWREGAVLQREGTRALVKVKPLEKLIEIKIHGSRKRELLAIIRNQFDHINSKIKKVKITEEIPCNCSERCPHKFDYTQLLKAENKGKVTVDCPESWEDVQLSLLLDGYKTKEDKYKYQVALSFAGEDRVCAEKLAELLKKRGIRFFYDSYEQANLWGMDLYQHFQSVYRDDARFCVIFLSKSYAKKLWTRHELKQAQARAFRENKDYILPVRIDDTEIPGINETIGCIDLRSTTMEEIADLLVKKLSP